jgi:hypothetical protein
MCIVISIYDIIKLIYIKYLDELQQNRGLLGGLQIAFNVKDAMRIIRTLSGYSFP